MIGLQYLFLEPNASDPLNKDAAAVLQKNRDKFKQFVRQSMLGGRVDGETFDKVS
jgi:ubiquitin-conjugating enzyme E2 M